ncbi:hypothetical protein [Paramicrobacterium agarici]|uniref:hypothetical protein n=1 Tax=Paramicrobacterium agarici TaxID=630514 RepID=UPI000BFA647F|nr:hypothetical protein [Microbacterium agarici]
MDQFSLHAIERRGAAAVPGSACLGHPGTREYESWSRESRMLLSAREQRRMAHLERRSRRLRARLTTLESRINGGTPSRPAITGF